MQKITVLITNNRVFTFHNAGFSTLDSTDFLGFGCKKNKKCIFSLDFEKTKNMELSETITPENQYCLEHLKFQCGK